MRREPARPGDVAPRAVPVTPIRRTRSIGRTSSTFSCDIAYSRSPAASRASARSVKPWMRTTCRSRTLVDHGSISSRAQPRSPFPRRNSAQEDDDAVTRVDELLRVHVGAHPKRRRPPQRTLLSLFGPTPGCCLRSAPPTVPCSSVSGPEVRRREPFPTTSHAVLNDASDDLHVLLRHRLLRQPGGFEGFLPRSRRRTTRRTFGSATGLCPRRCPQTAGRYPRRARMSRRAENTKSPRSRSLNDLNRVVREGVEPLHPPVQHLPGLHD